MSYRRELLDLVFLYNAVHGLHDLDLDLFVKLNHNVNLRSGNEVYNFVPNGDVPRSEKSMNFYSTRTIKIWNNLPQHIKCLEFLRMVQISILKGNLENIIWMNFVVSLLLTMNVLG